MAWMRDGRYKNEIRADDKEALRRLTKSQFHYQVTPEVLREIDASRCAALLVMHLRNYIARGLQQNMCV